jgi:hypothetical protein
MSLRLDGILKHLVYFQIKTFRKEYVELGLLHIETLGTPGNPPDHSRIDLPIGAVILPPIIEVSGGVPGLKCMFPRDCPSWNNDCYNKVDNGGTRCPVLVE